MLDDKPWKLGSLLRLLGGMLICVLLGMLVGAALRFPASGDPERTLPFILVSVGAAVALAGAMWLVLRPWPTEGVRGRGISFVLLLYGGLVLVELAQKAAGEPPPTPTLASLIITLMTFQGAVIILMLPFLRDHEMGWNQAFGFRRQGTRAVGLGLLVALGITPIVWGLQLGMGELMRQLGWEPLQQVAVDMLRATESAGTLAVMAVGLMILAPIGEEILFRGILYPALKGFGFPRLAFWGTAVVFGLVHFNAVTLVPLVTVAIALNLLYERTGNLLSCIVAHSLFNGLNLGLLMLQPLLEQRLSP